MIHIQAAYDVAGVVFAAAAASAALSRENRRWPAAVFFGLISVSFLAGDRLGDLGNGLLVLSLVLVGSFGGLRGAAAVFRTPAWAAGGRSLGNWIFLPILLIPAVTLAGTFAFGAIRIGGAPLVDPKQATVVALALGAVVALIVAVILIRPPLAAPATEGRRLLEGVGSAAILPQLLAALGAVFTVSGVGRAMQTLIGAAIPLDNPFLVVAAFCAGMALFTTVLGNAFAAFPVLVAALGAPVIVHRLGGNPAMMGAVGMLSGYCGTLVTPMASFNIIPAALLDLPIGAVIRVQIPTAGLVLVFNIALMCAVGFAR
ncbi:MAG TPA: DUF979 family protein [Caulobacteraceae bacterium]|jgi:uncharacterized membrane protein|nr:DUF979 family protein [Caulobacteraceae bacterium]